MVLGSSNELIKLGKSGNDRISLELATLVDTRMLIQANSGGGKSYAIRRLLEQSHGKIQQIVLDLEGEFSTLREKFEYVIAGKNADTPVQPSSAKMLARKLLELGVSTVCDLYELKAHDRVRFVRLFLESLMSAPKTLWHPVLVVLDEAHHFAPEKGQCESYQAVIDLATRGRKRGYCAILATQRLSKLHKDACAELLNKMVGRTSLDIDQRRAADELGIIEKQQRLTLRNLQPGEFHIYGPALTKGSKHEAGVEVLKVGSVQSRHPRVGARNIDAPPKPTGKIISVLNELKGLPAEAEKEAQNINSLRSRIRELERELKKQIPSCNHETEIKQLRGALSIANKKQEKYSKFISSLFTDLSCKLSLSSIEFRKIADGVKVPTVSDIKIPKPNPPKPDNNKGQEGSISLTNRQQQILDALAMMEQLGRDSVKKAVVAIIIGVSPKSSGYTNVLGSLHNSMELVNYPSPGYICLTDSGRGYAKDSIDIIDLEDYQRSWLNVIKSGRQVQILQELIRIYPEDIAKPELAGRINVSAISSGFTNNLGKLRNTFEVIEYPSPGRVKAAEILFPEELQ